MLLHNGLRVFPIDLPSSMRESFFPRHWKCLNKQNCISIRSAGYELLHGKIIFMKERNSNHFTLDQKQKHCIQRPRGDSNPIAEFASEYPSKFSLRLLFSFPLVISLEIAALGDSDFPSFVKQQILFAVRTIPLFLHPRKRAVSETMATIHLYISLAISNSFLSSFFRYFFLVFTLWKHRYFIAHAIVCAREYHCVIVCALVAVTVTRCACKEAAHRSLEFLCNTRPYRSLLFCKIHLHVILEFCVWVCAAWHGEAYHLFTGETVFPVLHNCQQWANI